MLDAIIRGGIVVDGTGTPAFTADIAIQSDTIVAVGTVNETAREVIDADGAIVTPGFFDLHTHYDGQVTWDDALEPSATNGIKHSAPVLEFSGGMRHCGSSPSRVRSDHFASTVCVDPVTFIATLVIVSVGGLGFVGTVVAATTLQGLS